MAQQVKDKTGHRFIIAFRKLQFHLLIDLFDAHAAVNLEGVLVDYLVLFFNLRKFIPHRADNFLDEPAETDDTGRAAELIDYHAHPEVLIPHLTEKLVNALGLRGKVGGPDHLINQTAGSDGAFCLGHEHVLHRKNPHHIIHIFLVDRKPGEREFGVKG